MRVPSLAMKVAGSCHQRGHLQRSNAVILPGLQSGKKVGNHGALP
jgi:hypothetical protein